MQGKSGNTKTIGESAARLGRPYQYGGGPTPPPTAEDRLLPRGMGSVNKAVPTAAVSSLDRFTRKPHPLESNIESLAVVHPKLHRFQALLAPPHAQGNNLSKVWNACTTRPQWSSTRENELKHHAIRFLRTAFKTTGPRTPYGDI